MLSGLELTLGCGFLVCGRAVVLSPGLLLMVLECALREVARGSRIAELLRYFFLPGALYALFLCAPMCTSQGCIFAFPGGTLCFYNSSLDR